jgi:hypothetical protein
MTDAPKDEETKFNETLKRMLNSPPTPQKPKPEKPAKKAKPRK